MDKASILRETRRLKLKLEFEPAKYGLNNLTILMPEPLNEEQAAFLISKKSKGRRGIYKNKREVKISQKCPTPSFDAKDESQQ